MKYKSIVVTARGGIDVLEFQEKELRAPGANEVQIKVLATPVCQDDIAVRVGNRPWLAKPPFVPGYSILGVIDAVGEGVSGVGVGDRVAALTSYGGHAEFIYLPEEKLVCVPPSLDPGEAVVLILNYLVAYQILHRICKVKPGDKALIVGASGGVGTAFLDLGRQAGLKMYGLASASKHQALLDFGAVPIDYHSQDFVEVIQQAEPEGIDFVFNGMFDDYIEQSMKILGRGGVLVQYGAPESLGHFLVFLAHFAWHNLLPNGKKIEGYGTHRLGVDLFKKDWISLFKLLEEGQIKPVVQERFPLLEAAQAYQLLESGKVTGNVVLLAPELF